MNKPAKKRDHLLTDQEYFLLDNATRVVLPALGALYFTLAQIWGLPYAAQVVGSLAALNIFLGVLVKVGETSYNNSGSRYSGSLNVVEQPDRTLYSLELDYTPEELALKDAVSFKVVKPHAPEPPVITYPLAPPSPPAA